MAQRGPKSKKILIWMGLGAFSESLARSGQNFGRSRAQDAQILGSRWSILASRWASWGELGRSWEHLGPNMVDLGGVLVRLGEDFGGFLGHGWSSKN